MVFGVFEKQSLNKCVVVVILRCANYIWMKLCTVVNTMVFLTHLSVIMPFSTHAKFVKFEFVKFCINVSSSVLELTTEIFTHIKLNSSFFED